MDYGPRMEKLGFRLIYTGGNCTAYCKESEDKSSYCLVTGEEGCMIPEKRNEQICVGFYNADEGDCVGSIIGRFSDILSLRIVVSL